MPIALFPELTATLSRLGRVLTPWRRITDIEEQVLRRARGAFLVQWFGTGIPILGVNLHIAIGNIDVLKRRYLAVQRSMDEPPPGLSLIGPLGALTGLIFGVALSPLGAAYMWQHADEIFEGAGGVFALLYRIIGVWLIPLLSSGLAVLATGGLLAGALAMVVGGDRTTRAIQLLLGELALLFDATIRLWQQLSGPRRRIRNPLLARIMHVLDRLTPVLFQLFGVFAFLITRVVRLMPNLMAQFRALGSLLSVVFDAVGDIFHGVMDRLLEPFAMRPSVVDILRLVFDTMLGMPGRMIVHVTELIETVTAAVVTTVGDITKAISAWVSGLAADLRAQFRKTPVGQLQQRVEKLLDMFPDVAKAFRDAPTPKDEPEEKSGWVKRAAKWIATGGLTGTITDLLESFEDIKTPGAPDIEAPVFPGAPDIASLGTIAKRIGKPELDAAALAAQVEAEASEALEGFMVPASALRDPPSPLAAERRKLTALGAPRLELNDEALRDLIYIAVGRVLPPALRVHAADVRAAFDLLDEAVYGRQRQALAHTMLELPDSGRLRPVVKLLTVHSLSGFASDVRVFRDLLVAELKGRTYLAPAAP